MSASPELTIFHIDGERGLRGGERQLLCLAHALESATTRNVVVCRADAPLDRAAAAAGLARLHLPFWVEWDPLSAWRLARAVRAVPGPVVLHAHTGHAAALAALVKRLVPRARSVVHRRVDFEISRRSLGLKYGAADRVVAVSEFIRNMLIERGLPAERCATVPDALAEAAPAQTKEDARARVAAAFGLDPAAAWIGNLAALVPHKNQRTLIEAFPAVLAKRPDALLLLAGEGPLRGELEALAARLGVAARVRFLGQVPDNLQLLRALDVYAQPSWGEGMGSVLLEAMACEVPIAATTAGGIPELVEDGRTGRLAPPRQAAPLAANLLALLEDREEARRLAAAGKAGLERFSPAQLARRTAEVYRSALA